MYHAGFVEHWQPVYVPFVNTERSLSRSWTRSALPEPPVAVKWYFGVVMKPWFASTFRCASGPENVVPPLATVTLPYASAMSVS
ncbi:organic solvent tolerance domain protein [Burkholderia thailandensis USAMRU Malaysia |nr:organic solvent tolerance domain protein [Burkholderia thailandensis USAMRU Malaysia \